ncbi:hypothetical protein LTR95_013046 [Oleoguttula sp. CCFEE 5521]
MTVNPVHLYFPAAEAAIAVALTNAHRLLRWTKGTEEQLAQLRAEYNAELTCRRRWGQTLQGDFNLSAAQRAALHDQLLEFDRFCTEIIDTKIKENGGLQRLKNYVSHPEQHDTFKHLHRSLGVLQRINNAMAIIVADSRPAAIRSVTIAPPSTDPGFTQPENNAQLPRPAADAPEAEDIPPPPYRAVGTIEEPSGPANDDQAEQTIQHIIGRAGEPATPPELDQSHDAGVADAPRTPEQVQSPETATSDGWYGQMTAALPAAQTAASSIPPGGQVALQSCTLAATLLIGSATVKALNKTAEATRVTALANTRNAVTAERLAAGAEQSAAAAMQAALVAEANAVTARDSLLVAQQSLALAQKEDIRKQEMHILDVAHRRAEEDRKAAKHPFELDQLRRQVKGEYKDASTQTTTPSINPIEEPQREAENSISASQRIAGVKPQDKGKAPLRCPLKHAELSVRTKQAIAPTLDDNRQQSETEDIVIKSDATELSSGTMATPAPVLTEEPGPIASGSRTASQPQSCTVSPASAARPLHRKATSDSGYLTNASSRQTSIYSARATQSEGSGSQRSSSDGWRRQSLLPAFLGGKEASNRRKSDAGSIEMVRWI